MIIHCSNLHDQRGMTLVEVLASLVIITVVFTSVLSVFMSGMAWISGAARKTEAVNYAALVLEELKSHPELVRPGLKDVHALSSDLPIPDGIGGTCDCQEYASDLGLYSVKVCVYWSSSGHQQTEQLVTLVYGSN
ncbi:MAG: type IV pilus modification PilV family protein [Acidobacteriota bacterium]